MPRRDKLSWEKKISNIKKTAEQKAKGVEHSKGSKRWN